MESVAKVNLFENKTTDAHRLTLVNYLCASVFICGSVYP